MPNETQNLDGAWSGKAQSIDHRFSDLASNR
jgi:hypothetical protein